MAVPLTKSYVNNYDSEHPIQEDLVLYKLFDDARKRGCVGEVIQLETGERMSNIQILDKADEYAKGLLALKLTPGKDVLCVLGCPGMEAACLFVAAASVGIAYAHPYAYQPREVFISRVQSLLQPRVVVVGEGSGGETFSALMSFYNESDTTPSSSELKFVEHIFYDNSYKDRSPTHKFLNTLDKLREMGKSITDQQLQEAKQSVKPEYVLHHLFSSGSTGKPKCVEHTHRALANELLQLRVDNLEPTLTMCVNVDEMISYSCIAWALSGKIKKTLLMPDYAEGSSAEDVAMTCAQAIVAENVKHLALPGTVLQMIRACVEENNIPIPAQEMFLNGAQIVSRQFKEDHMQVLKGKPFTAYGMCETFILAYTTLGDTLEDHEARMESRLYPKPNLELRLVDENNEVVEIGKDGEIQVKTYSFFKGYKTQEKETRQLFTDDGFLRTGDMAVMYPDGTFVIKGRAADAIRYKVFGDVIYPGPIEEVVSKYPGFRDVSVITGRCNDTYGDELTYCISLITGAKKPTEEELLAYCSEHDLNENQNPCRIIYFDKFPTTANSRKVSKARLREQVGRMIEEDPDTGVCRWFKEFMADMGKK